MKKNLLVVGCVVAFVSILVVIAFLVKVPVQKVVSYEIPETLSNTYNMNMEWKFTKAAEEALWPLSEAQLSMKKDGKNFYDVDYDDSEWEGVSLPHAISASLSFVNNIYDAGDLNVFRGIAFYRKNFVIPESEDGKKVFIEFEGMRQAAYVWVNGQPVGYYEAGITAFGFDITKFVKYGEDNVIAIANDSTSSRSMAEYLSETLPGQDWGSNGGVHYQWNTNDFNPTQAGLTQNVILYTKSDVYQTLPLYNNLKTTGNYIYADNFNIAQKSATINVDAEIRNESGVDKEVILEVNVVDANGELKYKFEKSATVKAATDSGVIFETTVPSDAYAVEPVATSLETVDVTHILAEFDATDMNFWSVTNPYLYDVYTILKVDDVTVDIQKVTTGFRKIDYSIEEGFKINDEYVFLTGYAQRSTNEWAAVGVANDWLTDYDMALVRESNANFIRWMHVAPKPNQIRSGDKYGIVSVVPAGDKEGDVKDRNWDQRVEAMRDTIIYYRNSPSVIFWEVGNSAVTAEHMQEMCAVKDVIDYAQGRIMGCRSISDEDQIAASEWAGTMLNRHAYTAYESMEALEKYIPIVETEYHREEAPRRVWDDYSPPDYDYDNKWLGGNSKTDGYDVHDHTSESFAVNDAKSFAEFYGNRVNGITGKNYYSATAALIWADSNQHGRNSGSENARTSGRVDAVRIKKQSFFAYQVMQSKETMMHIVGHWSYPELTADNYWYQEKEYDGTSYVPSGVLLQRDPTNKTVYVVATPDCVKIELLVDGKLVGIDDAVEGYFIHSFSNIDVTVGNKVEAIAYNSEGKQICKDEIYRTGEANSIRLTPVTSSEGLLADGADVMFYDVDVLDKNGNICVLNYDRIDFTLTGEGVFLGGYNSGLMGEESVIGKDYVYAECGQNRVFIRSTNTAGEIKLTASMQGINSVTATQKSIPVETNNGLSTEMPKHFYSTNSDNQSVSIFECIFGKSGAPEEKEASTVKMDLYAPVIKVTSEAELIEEYPKNFSVTVNSARVNLKQNAYKPDSVTGVVVAIEPVVKVLKMLGVKFEYTFDDTSLTIKTEKNVIVATTGHTFLQVNGEQDGDLLNAAPEIKDGEFVMELNALLRYIDGITVNIDEENCILGIKIELMK